MHKPFLKKGLSDEPLDWHLKSQTDESGTSVAVFETTSGKPPRTLHLESVQSESQDSQHLTFT